MSAFATLLNALGWSLLNSIWQMAVLWTLYCLLTVGNKRISAAARHNLAISFVATGTGWMICSFTRLLNNPGDSVWPGFLPGSYQAGYCIPCLTILYLGILLIRIIRNVLQFTEIRKFRSAKTGLPRWQSFVDRQRRILGISKPVEIYLSGMVETAETSGFLKPLILLPVSLLTRLTPEQIEAILVHELFHIRRNDYLINIGLSCFRGIMFFNPFARLFCEQISRERENACDDEVLEKGYAPAVYAEALFCLEKFRHIQHDFSIAADGHRPWLLLERIRRVTGNPTSNTFRFRPVLLISLLISCSLLCIQKRPETPMATLASAPQVDFLPAAYTRYELAGPLRKTTALKKIKHVYPIVSSIKKKVILPVPVEFSQVEELSDDQVKPVEAFFAEHKNASSFSNEQSAGPNEPDIPVPPGAPYVPSVSLSYEELPGMMPVDTLMDFVIQQRIKEVVGKAHAVADANLKTIQKEIEKGGILLKKMELKNKELIHLHQKNIKPMLENIQQQLQLKKMEADQLKLKVRITDEEIIHI